MQGCFVNNVSVRVKANKGFVKTKVGSQVVVTRKSGIKHATSVNCEVRFIRLEQISLCSLIKS